MKKSDRKSKKLRLSRETLAALESSDTRQVLGGEEYSQVISCQSAMWCCISKTGTD